MPLLYWLYIIFGRVRCTGRRGCAPLASGTRLGPVAHDNLSRSKQERLVFNVAGENALDHAGVRVAGNNGCDHDYCEHVLQASAREQRLSNQHGSSRTGGAHASRRRRVQCGWPPIGSCVSLPLFGRTPRLFFSSTFPSCGRGRRAGSITRNRPECARATWMTITKK